MIIDEDALNNSSFFLYTNEDIKNDQYIEEIDNLIHKYDITANSSNLTSSNDNKYVALINYSINLYYKNEVLPSDIAKVFIDNYPFKNSLNKLLEKKLENLIQNDSAIFFKDITSMIHLLCLGEKYEIFKTYNSYDYDSISNLFRFYEDLLREQNESDQDLYDTTFDSYIILMKAYTQLCVINSTDLFRKKTINTIIDLMTETINMLKFSLPLDERKMNKINNILGEHLYYFAHVSYIKVNKEDIDYTLKEYYMYLERQIDGYTLSKNTNFGDELDKLKNIEFITFKNNTSYLLLTLLQKLNGAFRNEDYFENKNFQKLLNLYYDNFALKTVDFEIPSQEEEFKTNLVDSLLHNYQIDLQKAKTINHNTIIDDFIFSGHNFDNKNLETVHNILLFADDIEDYKYIHIGQLLVVTDSIQNDYYEFFKLKTLDIIINYFIHKKHSSEIEELFIQIHAYVRENKTASHLLSMYSKIYLSLSLYSSYHYEDEELMRKAKTLYAIFIQTNGIRLLKNEYKYINQKILMNFGLYYKNILTLDSTDLNNEQLIGISKTMTKEYLLNRELELKYDISKGISELTNKIHRNKNVGYNEVNKVLVYLISKKIFHGLCEVHILGLTRNENKKFDAGYKQYIIEMNEQYSIQFIFPTVYEDNFKYILDYNKIFIENNIENILQAYSQNSVSYIDNTTGLYNLIKLEEIINKKNKSEKVTFIEVYIKSLFTINSTYGYEKGNDAFRSIAEKIESLCAIQDSIHKLNGARIGILLNNNSNYEAILEELKEINIKIDNNIVDINLYVCATVDKSEDILEKSSKNMDKAIINKMREFVNAN